MSNTKSKLDLKQLAEHNKFVDEELLSAYELLVRHVPSAPTTGGAAYGLRRPFSERAKPSPSVQASKSEARQRSKRCS